MKKMIEEMTIERKSYLDSLVVEYGETVVYTLADLLGPSEDYDGLVIALEDYENEYGD